MTDSEILMFIRDVMLQNPTIDAEVVWKAYKVAEVDEYMKELMYRYMEHLNEPKQKDLCINLIVEQLKKL